ncbi:MAG: DUF4785 family immunoglobulin-like domain-containing protein [Polyangiales bacterium]
MKTSNILAASLLTALLAGCGHDQTTQPTSAPEVVLATSAVRVRGDIVPTRLVAIALPAQAPQPVLSVSMPGHPKVAFSNDHQVPEISTRRDYGRIIREGSDPATIGTISFPITAPVGARVIVTSRDPHGSIPTAHLRDLTGKQLDLARDTASHIVQVQHIPDAAPKSKADKVALSPPSTPGAIGSGAAVVATGETTFNALNLPRRVLTVDVPAKAGIVVLDIPASVVKAGVDIDVQEPNSPVTLAGAPHELNYGFGDTAEIEYTLANDGAAIDGAKFEGKVELPNGELVPGMTFTSLGSGKYLARVPLAAADLKYIGVWHVHAKVTGSVNGVAFERDIENGFGYAPAHAQMNAIHGANVVKGRDGLVDEISFDVDIETLLADRLSIGGTLVFKDGDGIEHSVATAETSADMTAGKGTITLRFDAQDIAVTQASGPFFVRNVALTSSAFATTQHKLGRGFDLVTPSIAARDFRYPTIIRPAVDEMFEQGVLIRR